MSQEKMDTLCEIEGITIDDLAEIAIDSVSPGICMVEDCNYIVEVEPDQTQGWCEECEQGTVKSLTELIMEGFMPQD